MSRLDTIRRLFLGVSWDDGFSKKVVDAVGGSFSIVQMHTDGHITLSRDSYVFKARICPRQRAVVGTPFKGARSHIESMEWITARGQPAPAQHARSLFFDTGSENIVRMLSHALD